MELIETPFNYTGSKFKLLEQLIPVFDKTKPNFVDLFAGGGSVYANVVTIYDKIFINDIIKDLMEIQRNLILAKETTVDTVKGLVVSKEDKDGYNALRASYNEEPTPEKLYALMLCCTNNMMRFNKKFKFNQTFGKRTFNANTQRKIDSFSTHMQLHSEKLQFSFQNFYDFPLMSNSFYYLDPPYSNTEAGYNSYWESNDDIGLFEYCKKINDIGSTFAISGSETHAGQRCRLIDLLTEAGFKKILIDTDYNKVSRKGSKETQEVLVVNY